ncbi:MAG: heme-binding protein [Betaproteobacteria bacterium]|nr:heme-binding protein [Betaproteobacteria bacterium]
MINHLRQLVISSSVLFAVLVTVYPAHSAPLKVLHLSLSAAETGFDPVMTSDLNTAAIEEQLFEPLLTYDYLARPVKLIPRLAAQMPVISDQGKTWLFTLKKGVYFSPDPVFKGKLREVTAQDVVYTIMRFMDPKNRSPYKFLVDHKILGLNALADQARQTGHFNYNAKVEGLEVVGPYQLKIRLTGTDYNFGHAMAQPMFGIVAREVIEAYQGDTASHPVGTGPYMIGQWIRSASINLVKNPNYRDERWHFTSQDPQDQKIVQAMTGKRIPQIDQVDIQIVEEAQSAYLSFLKGELDVFGVPGQFAPNVLSGTELKPKLQQQGIQLQRLVDPAIAYYFINIEDPQLGGMALSRIALRRAILMSLNDEEMIRVIYKGQAFREAFPIPQGVEGHDANYQSLIHYNPQEANDLLDKMGYKKAKDGYRRQIDGGPLYVKYTTTLTSQDRDLEEIMKKSLDRIGIRFVSEKLKFPEIIRAERQCRVAMRLSAWIADYPDGDNFMQLWYGPHTHENNASCFQDAKWDKLYEKTLALPNSPERDQLYRQLARLLEINGVTKVSTSHIRNVLIQPWVVGYKAHPILPSTWAYIDLIPEGERH